MATLNEVKLIGRLTRDPDLAQTPQGKTVCEFGLATSRKYKMSDQTYKEETTFIDINCWGNLAQIVSNNLSKGRLIYVGGRLKFHHWLDKTTGQKRSKLTVVANNIQFLDWPSDAKKAQPRALPKPVNQEHNWSPSPPTEVTADMQKDYPQPLLDEPPF